MLDDTLANATFTYATGLAHCSIYCTHSTRSLLFWGSVATVARVITIPLSRAKINCFYPLLDRADLL